MKASEISPKKLVVFDIDDTLVHTQTKVHVVKDGQVVDSLNSHDFTHYRLKPGEEFDFSGFRNAREFFEKSKPIIPMMNQLKRDIATGNKVVMVTARADFDDKELFLDTFRKFGIDMGKVHVYRAGNSKEGTTEERKKAIIKRLLDSGNFTKAIMYDDAKPNLHTFIELKRDHPQTRFYAWHVSLEGEASEYMREDIMSERKKRRKRKSRWAAYGPGPYGGYGYAAGYSGDAGSDGGGVGEDSDTWGKIPLNNTSFVIQGYNVEFNKDGVFISKNGKVMWKKEGDYSNPTNKNMSTIRKMITGLQRKEKPFPGEYQQFGKKSPEELQARREWNLKRKKWMDRVYDYAQKHQLNPVDVMSRELVPFNEASYEGNVGMMEVAKFFKIATDAQKKLFKELLEKGKRGLAWKLIQDVTDTKLQGQEFDEAWSQKYKRSINCNNPKGFSQRAHCAGRKKKESIEEGFQQRTTDKLSALGMQGPYSKRDLVAMSSAWSKTLSGIKSSQIMVQDAGNPRHSAWIAPAGDGQWMVGAETGYTIKSGHEALKRLQFFLRSTNEEWDDDDEEGDIMRLHDHLSYPEVVDRISGMMRAMGWKVRRKGDDDFIFMTKGQLEDEWYTVSIGKTADGKGFTYALGTIEEGDPHIGQQDAMPNTVASVSMLADEIRDGFGMNENFADGKKKGKSRPGRVKRAGASCKGSVTDLRARAKKYGGERGKMYHWCANMKSGRK